MGHQFTPFALGLFGLDIAGVLLLTFVMIGSNLLRNQVWSFLGQAWLVACASFMLGIELNNNSFFVLAIIYALLRGLLLPYFFYRILNVHKAHEEKIDRVSPSSAMLFGLVLIVFSFIVSSRLMHVMQVESSLIRIALSSMFAIVLISFLMLVIRHHALSKIIALLMIENGIVLGGQFLVLDTGIFIALIAVFDVLIAVVSFKVMTRYMLEQIGDTDNRKMRKLIG